MNDPLHDLLRNILDPETDGDAPRLAYADLLEEAGEQARAEFIRVQVAIAAWRPYFPPPEIEEIRNSGRLYAYQAGLLLAEREAKHNAILVDLRRRERELHFDAAARDWSAFPSCVLEWRWRRGFVGTITMSTEDWMPRADELLAAHPIREVKLTTMPTLELVDPPEYWTGRTYRLAGQFRRARASWSGWVPTPLMARHLLRAEWPTVQTWHLPEV